MTSDYKLTYTDSSHAYYLNGKRCKGVTTVAKIPVESYGLEQWSQRQVAIGLTLDKHLIENIAVDIENKFAINKICEEAKGVAKRNRAADRGTQMHRVLQLVLLDEEHKLLTDQQRSDAELLKRTLDRYKLTPHNRLVEQFVIWPEHTVAGRFDAVLEKPDGQLILADLKSGPNAVTYPHSTGVQLALYARAPWVSGTINTVGDKSVIDQWQKMPANLDQTYAYVLLVRPDDEVGTLHEINIQHGWDAALHALAIVNWRKKYDGGKDMVREIPAFDYLSEAQKAPTLSILREIWTEANNAGQLTDELKSALTERSKELSL